MAELQFDIVFDEFYQCGFQAQNTNPQSELTVYVWLLLVEVYRSYVIESQLQICWDVVSECVPTVVLVNYSVWVFDLGARIVLFKIFNQVTHLRRYINAKVKARKE